MAANHGFFRPQMGRGFPYATLSKGGGDAIASFFADVAAADKFWHDFDRLDTQFQESTGVTPVTAATQSVGLWFDHASWAGRTLTQELAQQPELVTNGGFATGDLTGWTDDDIGTGVSSYSGGAMRLVGTDGSNSARRSQQLTLTVGRRYQVTWSASVASGTATVRLGTTSSGADLGFLGTGSGGAFTFVAGASNFINIRTDTGGGDVVFDNFSVKEIPRNHGSQATTNSRPTLQTTGVRGDGSDDNLLTPLVPGTSMTMLVKAKFGASGAARTLLGGTIGTSRCMLLRDSAGKIAAGVGTDSSSTIVGGDDVAGETGTAALVFNGTTVSLYYQEAGGAFQTLYSAGQNGAPGSDPLRLFATNNGGTAANFGNDDIQRVRVAKGKAATAAQIATMMAQLNALPTTLS